MNYSEALYFVFQDEKWFKKMLVGGLIAFVSFYCGLVFLTGFLLLGYYLHLIRNVVNRQEKPLPNWSDLGKIFVDGVMASIILLIYLLILGFLFTVPIVKVAADPYIFGVEKGLMLTFIGLVALIGMSLVVNAAYLQYVATNNFASALNVPEIFHLLKEHLSDFLAIIIFSLVLNGILFFVGLGIISPFTNFWGLVVQGHLIGQCGTELSRSRPMVKSA